MANNSVPRLIFFQKLCISFGRKLQKLRCRLYNAEYLNKKTKGPNSLPLVILILYQNLYHVHVLFVPLQNERLCYIITQSKWYTYDNHSQKMILILLNQSMNSEELWIGWLKPLNVLAATEVTLVFGWQSFQKDFICFSDSEKCLQLLHRNDGGIVVWQFHQVQLLFNIVVKYLMNKNQGRSYMGAHQHTPWKV